MGPSRPRQSAQVGRTALITFFALLALPYALVIPYLGALRNPNETARLYLTMALVDDASVRVDGPLRHYGWTNDLALVPDPAAPGGAYHAAVKGPALSVLAAPVYALERSVARALGRLPGDDASPDERAAWLRTTALTLQFFTLHVPCYAFLLWLERRLRAWTPDPVLRLSAVAALGLGTNYLAYSLLFASHALVAVAAFVALDLPWRAALAARPWRAALAARPWRTALAARPRLGAAFAAGLAAGLLPALEYTAAAPALGLALGALVALRGARARGAYAAGVALPLGLLALYQWRAYGDPLAPGHRLLETAQFRALSETGFYTLRLPSPRAAFALLFDGGFGLLATSPFFALAALAPASRLLRPGALARPERARTLALASAALAFALALAGVAASSVWRGGWTIGPRYLGAAPALLAPLALAGLEAVARGGARRRAAARAIALGLALASFVRGGAIGLLVTTLPETIERPLAQVLVPFLRLSLVPHHALELAGVRAPWPWWLAPAGALGAFAVVAAIAMRASGEAAASGEGATSGEGASSGEGVRDGGRAGGAATVVAALALAAVASLPGFVMPAGAVDRGPAVRSFFYDLWEPAGRDALARALERAARDEGAWAEVAEAAELAGKAELAAGARAAARGRD
ncbi:MAG TPA: hypothetical protein VFS00_26310 [Polyangiaceae bacterium]|nr:hypothetical protein [Polyangiaceae bacterium]